MNTGTDLARDIQTGFLTASRSRRCAAVALLIGQLGGTVTLGLLQAVVYLAVGLIAASASRRGRPACSCCSRSPSSSCSRSARSGSFAALRTGSGEAVQGLFPLFFVFLFISSMAIPRNLMTVTWFRDVATVEPGLLPDRGRPQPDHHRLGRPGARARLRHRRDDRRWSRSLSARAALDQRLARS